MPFTATFGPDVDDAASLASYWRQQEASGEPVARLLVELLSLPDYYPTRAAMPNGSTVTILVTPRYMHEETAANRTALEQAIGADRVARSIADGQYLGWRVGVTSDGDWRFFVAGD